MYKLQDDLVAKVRGALYYTGVSKLCTIQKGKCDSY